jgi:hypothetical protein
VRAAARRIGEYADHFDAEAGTVHRAGHHPEHVAFAQIDDPAQKLPRAPFSQSDHRFAHQRDAGDVVESARDFFAIDQLHPVTRPIRLRHSARSSAP